MSLQRHGYPGPYVQPGYSNLQPGYQQPGLNMGPIVQQPGLNIGSIVQQPGLNIVPIVEQPLPQGVLEPGWMTIPLGLSNNSPGLEYLSRLDQLVVHQKVQLLEGFVGYESNNKYTVKNNIGQKMFYAVEDNDCCSRTFCGNRRPFDMKIMNSSRNEVIHLHRLLACDSCLCPCWLQSMEVSSPPGKLIGTVEQEWSICKPNFVIKDEAGNVVLRIKGPFCTFAMCGDAKFNIFNANGITKVGTITKQWSGLAQEFFTNADYFGISFPMELDVKIKAVLLGACFLIDYMFFEKCCYQRQKDAPGML